MNPRAAALFKHVYRQHLLTAVKARSAEGCAPRRNRLFTARPGSPGGKWRPPAAVITRWWEPSSPDPMPRGLSTGGARKIDSFREQSAQMPQLLEYPPYEKRVSAEAGELLCYGSIACATWEEWRHLGNSSSLCYLLQAKPPPPWDEDPECTRGHPPAHGHACYITDAQ